MIGLIAFCLSTEIRAQNKIEEYINYFSDSMEVSLLAQNLKGEVLFIKNHTKKIPSASIIKIPILVSLYEEVEQGKINLDEYYEIKSEDIVGGSGELQMNSVSKKVTLKFLSEEMIRTSDNVATNIIIKKIGMGKINNSIKEKGFTNTQLNRLMMDFKAIELGKQNYTSPIEINKYLLMLENGEVLSENSRKAIIDILKNCADRDAIPKYLPKNILIAHKTGSLDYVRGDAAIIYSPSPIVLSIFIENFASEEKANIAIAKIAELIVSEFGSIE
jgi:beta-lactamase class A